MSKYTQLTYDVTPVQTIAFYDIDKKAWRSFSITHFIGFVSIYRLVENPHALHSRSWSRDHENT